MEQEGLLQNDFVLPMQREITLQNVCLLSEEIPLPLHFSGRPHRQSLAKTGDGASSQQGEKEVRMLTDKTQQSANASRGQELQRRNAEAGGDGANHPGSQSITRAQKSGQKEPRAGIERQPPRILGRKDPVGEEEHCQQCG